MDDGNGGSCRKMKAAEKGKYCRGEANLPHLLMLPGKKSEGRGLELGRI